MQKLKPPVSKQFEPNPRSKILNSYLATIEDSFRENRPRIKLINYGTGSGKTHQLFQAICETVEKYPDIQIIGVYVAPLREHLQTPDEVREQYPDIPIYKINSLEMKTTDDYIKLYKKWIPSILKNKKFWSISAREYSREKMEEARQNLNKVQGAIRWLEYVKKANFGDTKRNEIEIDKVVQDLNKLIEKFLEFLIKCKSDEDSWPMINLKLLFRTLTIMAKHG